MPAEQRAFLFDDIFKSGNQRLPGVSESDKKGRLNIDSICLFKNHECAGYNIFENLFSVIIVYLMKSPLGLLRPVSTVSILVPSKLERLIVLLLMSDQ